VEKSEPTQLNVAQRLKETSGTHTERERNDAILNRFEKRFFLVGFVEILSAIGCESSPTRVRAHAYDAASGRDRWRWVKKKKDELLAGVTTDDS